MIEKMMGNDYYRYMPRFAKLLETIPYEAHFKVHEIHNVQLRKAWGLPERKLGDFLLAYIRSGSGHYSVEGQAYPISPGNIILIGPGLQHSAEQYDTTPSLYSIRFGVYSNSGREALESIQDTFSFCVTPDNPEHFRHLFNSTYSCFVSRGGTEVRQLNCFITQILSDLFSELSKACTSQAYDMRLDQARVYIYKHPLENHTIERLSKIAGYSPTYFSRKFKMQYDLCPKEFIFRNKMEYARLLLTEYNFSIKEIASKLGYSDQYIFSNQFKKMFGSAPSKMKKAVN